MCISRRMLASVIFMLLSSAMLSAQTISPVVSEYGGKKASGSFTVTNNALVPLTVVVEPPQSLSFINGKPHLGALDPTVHLTLEEMSAKVGAKQSHEFSYKLECDTQPCAVTIYTTITGPHTASGLAVAIHLPHVSYLCDKSKGCRSSMVNGKP